MNYFFHPAAEAEYLESIAYYESKRAGLGASYIVVFEKTVSAVCASPHRYPTENKTDIRRAHCTGRVDFNFFGLNSLPLERGWLKTSSLKSVFNTSLLASECFIS